VAIVEGGKICHSCTTAGVKGLSFKKVAKIIAAEGTRTSHNFTRVFAPRCVESKDF
jgi:hypothetical protein